MRTKTGLFTTFIAAVIAVAAMGATGQPASAARHHEPAPPIVVVENDYDGIIQVAVGQQIEVMLQYPGYGQYGRYGWRLSDISGHSVKYSGRGPAGDGAVCYRLRAVKEGSATCTCVFEPPPWLMMPSREFEVTFEVQP